MDYREAGVDTAAADSAKRQIAALARGTFNAGVLSEIGAFGGLFRPDLGRFREPVLVASTDGVGTKIHVARAMGIHDSVGYDLVAHCVNDILVQGAEPLFFLDYIALGRMDTQRVAALVEGCARACREFGCPLIGGETAEMPGTYGPDDYDLAGFIVGVVERAAALTGERVCAGDLLLALPSAGLHTNGFTLARRVLFEKLGLDVHTHVDELGTSVGAALLAPHRAYLGPLRPLLERGLLHAMAHITGGGFPGNVPRVLPAGLGAVVRAGSWSVPPIFRLIERGGGVSFEEMHRTFNMGVGMVLFVAPGDAEAVRATLAAGGHACDEIGWVERGSGLRYL